MKTAEKTSGILVLGSHRCGTSLATRLIAGMGHDTGGELIPAAEDNPGGYWEHRAVVENHNDFLRAVGRSWSSLLPLEPEVFLGEEASKARARIKEIYESDFRGKRHWVLKDPRLCRLMPLWDDVLHSDGLHVGFVHVLRSPLAAAASLEKRDGMRLEAALVLWLRHVIEAERATRGRNRLWISVEGVSSDPVAEASRLATWISKGFGTADENVETLLDAVYRPDFFHHKQTFEDQALGEFPWVADMCRALYSWTTDERDSGRDILDRVSSEISIADRLMIGNPLAAHHSSQREERLILREEIEAFHRSVTTMRDEIAAHRNEGDHLRQSVTSMREEVVTHRTETDHLRTLVGELQHLVARVEHKHAELLSRSLDLTAEIEKKHLQQTEEFEQLQEESQRVNTELATLQATHKTLENEYKNLVEHIALQEEDIRSKDSEIVRGGDYITKLEEEIRLRDAEISKAGDHITSVERDLGRTAADKSALETELADLLRLIDDLKLELAGREQARVSTQETLDTMTNQLSWRVTAPLRKVRGLLSRQ